MAIRNIFKEEDAILRRRAREVIAFDERLGLLIDDMVDTMRKAEGVGLAAPQVGISRRVIVVETKEGGLVEIVNPVIYEKSGKQVGPEGCLSVDPSKTGYVERPMFVKVKGYDRKGKEIIEEGEGLRARAFCHEIDHLDGVLYIDRLCQPPKAES
ncbi:MAG: peptide deformylase [Clostridia bacterium]|jgi:peptide deformylase|nr:peptide deformylase [Clostridia bacterium]